MNLLALMRRRKKVWIHRLAAPFAVVWLTMLWQPCAMAMDGAMDIEHRCVHCPPPKLEHCDDDAPQDCGDDDRFNADRRAAKAKFGDDQKELLATPATAYRPFQLSFLPTNACLAHPATAPPTRPLPILFCTQLK